MTTAPALRPAPAGLPPSRCPDCGAALAASPHDDVGRCTCASDVASGFSDGGRRLPVRAVFSTTSESACAACGGTRRRVLVGDDVGVACDGCGVIVRRARPTRVVAAAPFSRFGLVVELLIVAVAAAGLIALVAHAWPTVTAG